MFTAAGQAQEQQRQQQGASNIYGYAALERVGLGNMLLPWARCEVFCRTRGLPMLAPRWTRPKIGPWLRRERDKRLYFGLFDNCSYLRGIRRLALLSKARRIGEDQAADALSIVEGNAKPTLVVFSGMGRQFEPLLPHRDLIVERLNAILSPRSRQLVARGAADFGPPHVTIHVRRGDMPVLEPGQPKPAHVELCAPHISWYVNGLGSIRSLLGSAVPARVFSDAPLEELKPLLDLPDVHLEPANPSIVDILLLARGRILIATANSSFSGWASFLGNIPAVLYPGNLPDRNWPEAARVLEADLHGRLPSSSGAVVHAAWSASLEPSRQTLVT